LLPLWQPPFLWLLHGQWLKFWWPSLFKWP
jgi:hypothetical protein